MMTLITLICLVLFSLPASAQTPSEMRDSLTAATEALAQHPQDIDLRLRKAAWNLQLEQWDYALREYDQVLRQQSDNLAALYFRAYVNERIGRYNFARKDYESMLAIVPGHFEAELGLALLNQKDKHYTEAMDLLNSLCSRFPTRSEAFAARGGVEMQREMYDLAAYDYAQAVDLDTTDTDYRLALIDALIRLKRNDEARIHLDILVSQGISRASLEKLYRLTY